jgi:hypothetical protein
MVLRLAMAIIVVLPLVAAAGPRQQELLYAPAKHAITVSNARVTASLDHQIGNPGDTLQLHLETDREVELGIVVMGSSGNEGRDIPYPPLGILHKTVKVSSAANIPIQLRGAKSFGAFAQYQVIVMSAKEASTLEGLRTRATAPIRPRIGTPSMSKSGEQLFQAMSKLDPKTTATLYAVARTPTKAIAIVAPETAKRGQVFNVRVTFANPSDKADRVTIVLQSPITLAGDDSHRVPYDAITIDPKAVQSAVQPRKPLEVTFQVTSKKSGPLALTASCAGCGDDAGAAFEAVEITD